MKKTISILFSLVIMVISASIAMADATCQSGTTPVYVETVTVSSDGSSVVSANVLASGVTYLLEASGTANAGGNIYFDAEYSTRSGWTTWEDGVLGYEYLGPNLLDLKVNGGFVDWGAYNAAHTYQYILIGDGNQVNFNIFDTYPSNNVGVLSVDVYQCADILVQGGGHMLEENGKRKNWLDISFGGFIADAGALGLVGNWQINFHNVNDDTLPKLKEKYLQT